MRRVYAWMVIVLMLSSLSAAAVRAQSTLVDSTVYLPLVMRNYNPYAALRTVNAPYLNVADVTGSKLAEMAIFWFGQVTDSSNYVDVRVGYNNTELVLYVAMFDRYIWYDTTPVAADLLNWDSVSVLVSLAGNTGSAPGPTEYRFDVQYSGGSAVAYQTAYRGTGSGWAAAGVPFSTFTTDRWESGPPNGDTSKGWVATLRIPFASLGISRPADGTHWGLAVINRDRDSYVNPAIAEKTWPETADNRSMSSWGRLRFGLPSYSAPGAVTGTTTVRQGSGVLTPDGGVGGYTICGGSNEYWSQWGLAVYYMFAGTTEEYGDFNIQNQSDISDWPCFSKYYITFPLTAVPGARVIRSATLTLHQFGNSEPSQAQPSYIQVLTVASDWSEPALNWNNAPLALENVAISRVDALPDTADFPGVPRSWDVSRAVAQAYASGQPLRLVMYSADSHFHSGKYFVSADTGDWNAEGRPKVTIEYGTP